MESCPHTPLRLIPARSRGRLTLPRVAAEPLATVAFGAVLAAIALQGGGGLQLGPLTKVELAIDAAAGGLAAAAIVVGGHTRRLWGAVTLSLIRRRSRRSPRCRSPGRSSRPAPGPRRTAPSATSPRWWRGVALVRLFPQRWGALLGGVVLASVIVCGYALLTKVFPGALNPDEVYARLREPFGYWNSVGLMAAVAGPACLWLGRAALGPRGVQRARVSRLRPAVRRSAARLLARCRCSRWPAAAALWFAIVPLRLRGVAVLATSAFCGGLVAFWAFSQNALSTDKVLLPDRVSAGHELGIALVAMVIVLLIAGLAIGFATAQRAPSIDARRQAGIVVVLVLALVPVALVGALALSSRGLGGSHLQRLERPHRPATPRRRPPTPRPAHRGGQRPRALLERGAEDRTGAQGARRRRGGLRDRRARASATTSSTCATPTATSCRRWPTSASSALAISLALLAAWLAAAARDVGLAGARRRAPWTPRARRHGHAAGDLRRLRRALVRRLDLVRARQRRARRCSARAGWPAAAPSTSRIRAAARSPAPGRARAMADRAGGRRRRRRRARRVDGLAAPARGRRGLRRARARAEAGDFPQAPRADRRTPSAPTRCRSTALPAGGDRARGRATRRARAARCRRPCASSPPTRRRGCAWPSSSSARATGPRRCRPWARRCTSTRARRRRSAPICEASGRQG